MKPSLIFSAGTLALIFANCSKEKQKDARGESKQISAIKQPKPSPKTSEEALKEALQRLRRMDLNMPDLIKGNYEFVEKTSSDISNQERISKAEALNQLYLAVAKNQPRDISASLRGFFGRVIINSPQGIESIMRELPAGELRSIGVAAILGSNLSLSNLNEVYRAMPDSLDRGEIASEIVTRTFLENGVVAALDVIRSYSNVQERSRALDSLASAMATANQPGGRSISEEDIGKVKVYADSVGQKRPIRTLDQIRTPTR